MTACRMSIDVFMIRCPYEFTARLDAHPAYRGMDLDRIPVRHGPDGSCAIYPAGLAYAGAKSSNPGTDPPAERRTASPTRWAFDPDLSLLCSQRIRGAGLPGLHTLELDTGPPRPGLSS